MRIIHVIATMLLLAPLVGAEHGYVVKDIDAQVTFAPDGGCVETVVREIGEAKQHVHMQAYLFSSRPIAQALRDAKQRGVAVELILDKTQRTEVHSAANLIANAGIPVKIDEDPPVAHSKVIVIDDHTVLTGSFNYTKGSAERNVENLLVLRSKPLAEVYLKEFASRWEKSVVFQPRADAADALDAADAPSH